MTQALLEGGGASLLACNDTLNAQLRGKLSKLERTTLGALTTIDVHNRDVVAEMVELGTHEASDFEWMSRLRYYWERCLEGRPGRQETHEDPGGSHCQRALATRCAW